MTSRGQAPGFLEISRHLDPKLLLLIGTILAAGLVMLTSASISLADRNTGNPLFYFERQLGAVVIGLIGAGVMLHIPSRVWERAGLLLVVLAVGLLILVLVFLLFTLGFMAVISQCL